MKKLEFDPAIGILKHYSVVSMKIELIRLPCS